jgi:hypothetical protein
MQADVFLPGDPRTEGHAPWVQNLADNVKMRKLSVARHLPLHGQIVPHREFLQVVKDGFDVERRAAAFWTPRSGGAAFWRLTSRRPAH